jgi:hypothetical protein
MLVNKAATREWKATDYPGIDRSLFRNNETGGRSSVVRLVRERFHGMRIGTEKSSSSRERWPLAASN